MGGKKLILRIMDSLPNNFHPTYRNLLGLISKDTPMTLTALAKKAGGKYTSISSKVKMLECVGAVKRIRKRGG